MQVLNQPIDTSLIYNAVLFEVLKIDNLPKRSRKERWWTSVLQTNWLSKIEIQWNKTFNKNSALKIQHEDANLSPTIIFNDRLWAKPHQTFTNAQKINVFHMRRSYDSCSKKFKSCECPDNPFKPMVHESGTDVSSGPYVRRGTPTLDLRNYRNSQHEYNSDDFVQPTSHRMQEKSQLTLKSNYQEQNSDDFVQPKSHRMQDKSQLTVKSNYQEQDYPSNITEEDYRNLQRQIDLMHYRLLKLSEKFAKSAEEKKEKPPPESPQRPPIEPTPSVDSHPSRGKCCFCCRKKKNKDRKPHKVTTEAAKPEPQQSQPGGKKSRDKKQSQQDEVVEPTPGGEPDKKILTHQSMQTSLRNLCAGLDSIDEEYSDDPYNLNRAYDEKVWEFCNNLQQISGASASKFAKVSGNPSGGSNRNNPTGMTNNNTIVLPGNLFERQPPCKSRQTGRIESMIMEDISSELESQRQELRELKVMMRNCLKLLRNPEMVDEVGDGDNRRSSWDQNNGRYLRKKDKHIKNNISKKPVKNSDSEECEECKNCFNSTDKRLQKNTNKNQAISDSEDSKHECVISKYCRFMKKPNDSVDDLTKDKNEPPPVQAPNPEEEKNQKPKKKKCCLGRLCCFCFRLC